MDEKIILGNLNNIRSQVTKNEWIKDIVELEIFFSKINIQKKPIVLNSYATIVNCNLYIQHNLSVAKANIGNENFISYLNRLKELKEYITNNQDK